MDTPLDIGQKITSLLHQSGLSGIELKSVLRDVVRDNWPDLLPWSTLLSPMITEVQTATAAGGVVMTFEDEGVRKVILEEAGEHYQMDKTPSYMLPGGFINLTYTPAAVLC